MEAALRLGAGVLMNIADKQAQRRKLITYVPQGVAERLLKFILHLGGFAAFVWAMFQVHSIAGWLSVALSCFVFSTLIGGKTNSTQDSAPTPSVR